MPKIAKKEGDPALNRFVGLRVEEVSLVDAAANEEEFLVVKRRPDNMPNKENGSAKDPKKDPEIRNNQPVQKSAGEETKQPEAGQEPKSDQSDEQPNDALVAVSKLTDVVQKLSEQVTALSAQVNKSESAPIEKNADGFSKLNERLDTIEKSLSEQKSSIDKIEVIKAAAKGQAVDGTSEPAQEPEPVKKSKWSGTSIHSVFGRNR